MVQDISVDSAKNKARCRAYYYANIEKMRARDAARYAKDPEKRKAQGRESHERNRDARLARAAEYRARTKEQRAKYRRAYRVANRERLAAEARAYRAAKPDCQKTEKRKAWIAANQARQSAINAAKYAALSASERVAKATYQRKWRDENREKIRATLLRKYHSDPQHRLAILCRSRLRLGLLTQGAIKSARTFALVGCSKAFLFDYLAAQFKRGMTWDNYGTYWHIDHIIPCAAFDLTDPEEQRRCFHYSNLRPLKAKANLAKGKKLPGPHQALLL